MLLLFNYTDVMWPRCELLMAKGERGFDLGQTLSVTDEEFCTKNGFEIEELIEKKRERKYVEEVDRMWVYVPAM